MRSIKVEGLTLSSFHSTNSSSPRL